jgi:disulfide bond formation protein DsbB
MTTPVQAMLERRWAAPALVAGLSAGALAFALVAQYGFGLAPCVLCLYQRWPFVLTVLLGLIGLWLVRRGRSPAPVLLLAGLAFLVNAGIAAFHVGVEQHWWRGTAECTGGFDAAASLEALKAQLLAAPVVRCDEVAWSLFGLSMAGWNVLLSGALAVFSLVMARRLRGRP